MTDRRWNKSSGSSFCRNGLFLAICIKEEEETEQIKEFLTSLRVSLLVILTCGIKKINKRSVEEKEEEATLLHSPTEWVRLQLNRQPNRQERQSTVSRQISATRLHGQITPEAHTTGSPSPVFVGPFTSVEGQHYTALHVLYTSVGVAPKATHEVSNVPPPQPPTTPERNEDRRTDK